MFPVGVVRSFCHHGVVAWHNSLRSATLAYVSYNGPYGGTQQPRYSATYMVYIAPIGLLFSMGCVLPALDDGERQD